MVTSTENEIRVIKEMSLAETRAEIELLEESANIQFYPHMASYGMNQDGRFVVYVAGEEHPMSDEAFVGLGRLLGVPGAAGLFRKTPVSLLTPIVQHYSGNSDELIVTGGVMHDGEIGFVRRGVRDMVPMADVMDMVESKIGGHTPVHHASFSPDFTRFSVLTAENPNEVRQGDPVRFGITITNTMTPRQNLDIAAYTHRLVCTNGAVSVSNTYRYKSGGDDDHNDWLETAIDQAIDAANLEFARLEQMSQIILEGHISTYMLTAKKEFKIPTSAEKQVWKAIMDNPPRTLYDLYNIVTDVASNSHDARMNPRFASRLMRSASLMTTHQELCESCMRPQ